MKPRNRMTLSIALVCAVLIPGCGGTVEIEPAAETTQAIERFNDEMSNIPMSLAFSADGRSLYVGTGLWNAKLRSWDVATGALLHEVEVEAKVDKLRSENGSFVSSIAPAIESSTIAFGGRFTRRTTFATWDGASRALVEIADVAAPLSVAPGIRPGEFFCGSADGGVSSVDVSRRRVTPVGKLRFDIGKLFSVPNARLLFAVSARLEPEASDPMELAAWNVESGDQIYAVQLDHSVAGIDVTRDGRRIAVADKKGHLIIYEFDGRKFRLGSRREFGDSFVGVAWSHDASRVAAVVQAVPDMGANPRSADDKQTDGETAGRRILRVWETAAWTEVQIGLTDEHVVAVAFSPAAPILAVLYESRGPTVVDLQSGQIRRLDRLRRASGRVADEGP